MKKTMTTVWIAAAALTLAAGIVEETKSSPVLAGTAQIAPLGEVTQKVTALGTLIGLVVCELLLLVFRVNQSVTDWIAAGLFSLYIGYDLHRSQQFAKTLDNAVDCALDIYLDIANLFLRLLRLLSRKKD